MATYGSSEPYLREWQRQHRPGFLSDVVDMTFAVVVLLSAVTLALLIGIGLLVHHHGVEARAAGTG
jgi:hypothetical protein